MFRLLHDIGWAAGRVHGHAHLLTIDRDDLDGSAADDDEDGKKDEHREDIADQDERLDDDDLDDQPRGRHSDKSAKAYDELKSERDKLKADNEKKDRLLQEVNERLARLDEGRETREEVNARTNAAKERARERARQVVEELKKIPDNDPAKSVKVYERIFETVFEDQERTAEEISRRTSAEVVEETRSVEQRREDARKETLAALEEAGLDEQDFELVQGLAVLKRTTDPGWFKRTAPEDQIPELVQAVKERIVKRTRDSEEHREDKRRHRAAMDGVIGDGSRGRRGQDEDRDEGPGSILADLSRLKQTQRRNTQVMLRQR